MKKSILTTDPFFSNGLNFFTTLKQPIIYQNAAGGNMKLIS
jgi:hypothetical protein